MTQFDHGYESAIHFPGSNGPPISLRETGEVFERELPRLNPAALQHIPSGFPQRPLAQGTGDATRHSGDSGWGGG